MDCMTPSGTMEGTLATALRNSWAVAISDLLDDGKSGSDRIVDEQTFGGRLESTPQQKQQQQQQPKIESISKSSHCSPYDTLYWFGGDCMRDTAATSLSTIAECTTMKTDNTTEITLSPPGPKEAPPAIPLTPESTATTISEEEEPSTEQSTNENNESKDKPTKDIISEYRKLNSNPKALFDDYGDFIDYNDPLNSLIVDESAEESKTYNSRSQHTEYLRKSNRNIKNINDNSIFCVKSATTTAEPESDDWASPIPTPAWCGGYPSLLMYGGSNEDEPKSTNKHDEKEDAEDSSPKRQTESEEQYPEYYAEFKPQRQYAFDEGDSDDSGSTLTPTREVIEGFVMDGGSTIADRTAATDGDSLLTGVGSVQSFMVINRPHTTMPNINQTPLTRKLQRGALSSRRVTPDFDRHLHKLIASTPRSVATADEENENNSPLDHALSQHLMRKLQKHLPYGKRGDSFWLQYSLIRDGASLDRLLDMVHKDSKTSNHISSILAIETVEGEVFGAFLTQTWRRSNKQWYGGGQSFLWTTCIENSKGRRKLRVFPYSFENSYVQLCDRERLLVGGGDGGEDFDRHCYGFGLALENDLLRGNSCPCTTFDSPSLSKIHSDGSTFEIRNLEVWTLTPCLSMIENPSEGLVRVHKKEAEKRRKQEKEKLKLQKNATTRNGDDLDDFYSCVQPQCSNDFEIGGLEEVMDLSSSSFPSVNLQNATQQVTNHLRAS